MAKSQSHDRFKVVVRKLPPNLPEPVFWQSVQNWVSPESAIWKIFYPGKLRKGLNKENLLSRAYIAFKTEEQLVLFNKEYDGHLYRDKTGVEYQAIVEFAPYQKIPGEKKKFDNRNATIENDEDFLSFIQSLNAEPSESEPLSMDSLAASVQPASLPTTTPLLEALKAERTANKDKEAILRNHAHYKEQTTASVRSKKDEGKKKSTTDVQVLESSLGKKTGKKGGSTAIQDEAPAPAQKQAKLPKAPKPAKQLQHPSKQAQLAISNTPLASVSAPVAPPSADTAAPTSAPRRVRPMIGLGRQLEAALSGAGVNAGVNAGKPIRGRKEPVPVPSANSADEIVQSTPSSPKRERKRKERPPTTSSSPSVPSILQRGDTVHPVTLQRESPLVPTVTLEDSTMNGPVAESSSSRGGKRRGRGRGRGANSVTRGG